MDLKSLIREIPDFPKPGILFRDITTLLRDPEGFRYTIDRMAETLDKFEEDVLQKPTASIKGRRRAVVQFGEPLPVVGDRKIKNQTTEITTTVEQRVQAMLDKVA